MIVVDSSVWIDFFNGREAPHVRRLSVDIRRNDIGLDPILINSVGGIGMQDGIEHVEELDCPPTSPLKWNLALTPVCAG